MEANPGTQWLVVPLKQVPEHRPWATERWLRRAVYERRMPYFKVDGKVLIDLSDLDAYVAARRVESADGRDAA